jgi:aminopeptidase-like protein
MLDVETVGLEAYQRICRLYPICRSITGDGVRETLRVLASEIDIKLVEIASGTPVLDWTIPKEWNIRQAYIKDRAGQRVVDFRSCNLHVVNYSVPIHRWMSRAELEPHLFSIPERPDWIPYKTSYYKETWGFCVSDRARKAMQDDEYEVCIDSSLTDGHLTFGECVLRGRLEEEVLFSCHVCHPALCNDNLSGVAVAVSMAKLLAQVERRYTYRFLFVPGTIGAIAWLALNDAGISRIKHGLVLACIGDRGSLTYKRSRRGDAEVDRAVAVAFRDSGRPHELQDFTPYGYDERQYCSPGFDLPMGVLSRTPHGRFAEYHTSADNLDFVDPISLGDSISACAAIVDILESNRGYRNLCPKGEPQLGRRGLYATMGGHGSDSRRLEEALLWVLNMSDGTRTLLNMAERSRLSFGSLRRAATLLMRHDLLEESPVNESLLPAPPSVPNPR